MIKKLGGIHLKHLKGTEFKNTEILDVPDKVIIPMLQHMGADCEPIVSVGDKVKVGQKIGDTDAYISVPVHSSVSGEVVAITDFMLSSGKSCKAIEIKTDKLQTICEDIKPPVVENKKDFIKAVKESGVCGLGGAGFPTHVKLNFDPKKTPIDTLIINAAECEPYITSDFREMIENKDDVVSGILTVMKMLGINNTKLCIESNKPVAIKEMTEAFKDNANVEVFTLPENYPQGAEKVIIYASTKRVVPEGELPSSVGVVVMNVSTVGFISRYLKTGMPLISKRITVEGTAIKNPTNVQALIGTPAKELLAYANCDEVYEQLIFGGLMMGTCILNEETPIMKTTNALLAIKKYKAPVTTDCIRCGKCIRACPMGLMPSAFEKAYKAKDVDRLNELKLSLCINCGNCTYVCPAKIQIAQANQLAKVFLKSKSK